MWVVTAALLLAAPAADVALDLAAVVDQQVAHAAARSLLPQHQQLLADTTTSTPVLDKLLAGGVVHSALWEAKHAEPPKTTRHSAIWEAKEAKTKASSSKVELRKTIQRTDDPDPDPDQVLIPKEEGEGKQGKQEEQQGQQGQQEEEEEDDAHKAINVVVSVMLFGSLTFIMSLFYLVNYPDPQIRAQAWRAVSQTIVIFVSVLVFNASNGFVTWHEHPEQYSMAGLDTLLRVAESVGQPDTGDFLLAIAQLGVWMLVFQFAVSVCAGVVFWQPNKLLTGSARGLDEPALTDVKKGDELKKDEELKKGVKVTPTAADLEISTTASTMILGHVAGFAGINAFGTLMQLSPFADSVALCFLAWCVAVLGIVGMVVGSEMLRDACLRKLKGDWYASSLLQAKLQLLDHQAHHGGNDVIALVASFLLIQVRANPLPITNPNPKPN